MTLLTATRCVVFEGAAFVHVHVNATLLLIFLFVSPDACDALRRRPKQTPGDASLAKLVMASDPKFPGNNVNTDTRRWPGAKHTRVLTVGPTTVAS